MRLCATGRRWVFSAGKKGSMVDSANRLNGATRLMGVIGSPISNSSSPEIHNAVFEKLGANYAYTAFDVAEENLEAAVRGFEALGFLGYNVTAPHKTRILSYLHEVSQAAEIMGAVNTVVVQGGRSLGDNADGAAFMRNLVMNGINILGKKITVVGVGGAGSAVTVQAALDGVAEIDVFNRDDEYMQGGRDLIERLAEHSDCKVTLYDLADEEQLRASLNESVLLVHATNVGTLSKPGCLIDQALLPKDIIVSDMVYLPRETELLARARANGNKVLDGVGVFVQQAAIGERLWLGLDMPCDYVTERFFS